MKKILFVTSEYPPGPGGIGNQASNIVSQLQAKGMTTLVVTERRPYPEAIKEAGVIYLQRGRVPFVLTFLVNVIWQALRFQPDVVFVSGSKSLIVGAFLPLFKKIAIYHGHEWHMSKGLARLLIRACLLQANEVVAVSNFSRSKINRLINRQVRVIPNGIDLAGVKVTRRKVTKPTSVALNLLTVGALSARKGQLNVVRALPQIRNYYPDITYHMAGVPLTKEAILAEAERLKVKHALQVHGVVDAPALAALYQDADIFLMLSNNVADGDVEGFGIAILEANAYGVPAIGARGTGIEEAINDGYNGVLVDSQKPDEIINAINTIMKNYTMFCQQSKEMAAKHQWKYLINEYLKFLN